MPGAAARCRLMVPEETAEVCAVCQALMKHIHICPMSPGQGWVTQDRIFHLRYGDATLGCLWVSCKGSGAPKTVCTIV